MLYSGCSALHGVNPNLKKRVYPTKSFIKIGESLTWNEHIDDITIKLSRAIIREFVNTKFLNSIHNGIFDCHLNYANTVWGQNKNLLN